MPIFDQGYQHWQGALSGQGWRWLAVARHGVRVGLGSWFLRIMILFAWVPALALAAAVCVWGLAEQKTKWAMALLQVFVRDSAMQQDPARFRLMVWTYCFKYFIWTEMFFVMIVVMMVGPRLISQDLRFNAMPLYFSRPVRRIDYFLGKLGVIGFFLALVAVLPAAGAWVLGVLCSMDFSVAFDTARLLLAVVVYGVVVTCSAGLFILAISSLSRSSRYVGAAWAGIWIITTVLAVTLQAVEVYHVAWNHRELQQRRREIRQLTWAEEHEIIIDGKPDAEQREARRKEIRERKLVLQRQQQELRREIKKIFDNDWRPCLSYTQNLERIGDELIGFYAAHDRLNALLAASRKAVPGKPVHPDQETEESTDALDPMPRWPWYWSAGILAVIAGLSLWILSTRVKSLDRLR